MGIKQEQPLCQNNNSLIYKGFNFFLDIKSTGFVKYFDMKIKKFLHFSP